MEFIQLNSKKTKTKNKTKKNKTKNKTQNPKVYLLCNFQVLEKIVFDPYLQYLFELELGI